MGSVDKAMAKRERNVHSREENFKRRKEREEQDRVAREEKVILQTSESEQESGNDNEAFGEPSSNTTSKRTKRKRGTHKILNEKSAVCLDMAKVSDRNAALVLTPALQHLGHDPAEFNIN